MYDRSVDKILRLSADRVDVASSQEKGSCRERLESEIWVME